MLFPSSKCRVPKLFRLEDDLSSMTKLNKKKIRYLILEADKGKPTGLISRELKVAQRRVQQLYREKQLTGIMPILKRERRPKTYLNEQEKQLINNVYSHHKVGARLLNDSSG